MWGCVAHDGVDSTGGVVDCRGRYSCCGDDTFGVGMMMGWTRDGGNESSRGEWGMRRVAFGIFSYRTNNFLRSFPLIFFVWCGVCLLRRVLRAAGGTTESSFNNTPGVLCTLGDGCGNGGVGLAGGTGGTSMIGRLRPLRRNDRGVGAGVADGGFVLGGVSTLGDVAVGGDGAEAVVL